MGAKTKIHTLRHLSPAVYEDYTTNDDVCLNSPWKQKDNISTKRMFPTARKNNNHQHSYSHRYSHHHHHTQRRPAGRPRWTLVCCRGNKIDLLNLRFTDECCTDDLLVFFKFQILSPFGLFCKGKKGNNVRGMKHLVNINIKQLTHKITICCVES